MIDHQQKMKERRLKQLSRKVTYRKLPKSKYSGEMIRAFGAFKGVGKRVKSSA